MFASHAPTCTLEFWGVAVSYRAWEVVEGSVLVTESLPGEPDTDKTGGLVWSGGHALARCLAWPPCVDWQARRLGAPSVSGTYTDLCAVAPTASVLELGCGPALASMVLAKFGAPHLVATDGSRAAVTLAEGNIKDNRMAEHQSVSCGVLNWNHVEEADEAARLAPGSQALIIASDVIYPGCTDESIDNLFALVAVLLEATEFPSTLPAFSREACVSWFNRVVSPAAALQDIPPVPAFIMSFVDRKRSLASALFPIAAARGFGCTEICWTAYATPPCVPSEDDVDDAPALARLWPQPPTPLPTHCAPEGARVFVFTRLPPAAAPCDIIGVYCGACRAIIDDTARAFACEVYPRLREPEVEFSSDDEWAPPLVEGGDSE